MKIIQKHYKETEYLLYKYKMFEISIKTMGIEIEYLRKEDGGKGIAYDNIQTSPTNRTSSCTENIALSITEKIDYLETSIRRIRSKIERMDKAIEGLTEIERVIIEQRYIEGKQWWQVGSEVKYSERHCKRIRSEAIIKIAIGLNGDKIIKE